MATLRWMRPHLGLVAEVVGYGFFLWVDLGLFAADGPLLDLRLPEGLVVALLVLARRLPAVPQVPVAVAALVASLTLSAMALVVGRPELGNPNSFAEQFALTILTVAVLRRYPLREALLLTGLTAAAVVASPLLRSTTTDIASTGLIFLASGWGGAVIVGLVWRDAMTRRRASLEEVRSAERMELARELHDVVAHHVTGIIVAAQAAAVVARTSPDDVDRALATIEHAGTDAMSAMRRMVGVLRGQDGTEGARTPGAELGGVAALVARFDPDSRFVRLSTDPGLEHAVLPAGVAVTGYRVVQEALTNVRRHAPKVTRVDVDLRIREEELLVSVRNDGVPAAVPTPRGGASGFGLVGMAERVTALDGDLTAGPTAPGEWTVAARLPLAKR